MTQMYDTGHGVLVNIVREMLLQTNSLLRFHQLVNLRALEQAVFFLGSAYFTVPPAYSMC